MQIEQETIAHCFVMRPIGRLDGVGAPQLASALNAAIDEGGTYFVLDLSRLGYISSVGLRVILMAGKRLLQTAPVGGGIALAALTANVREVFEMSGFLSLFPVADDIVGAAQKIAALV